jgi:hypothetical protein
MASSCHGKYNALVSDSVASHRRPDLPFPRLICDLLIRSNDTTADATHKAQLENIRLRLSAASFFLILNLNVLVSARSDRVRLSPCVVARPLNLGLGLAMLRIWLLMVGNQSPFMTKKLHF